MSGNIAFSLVPISFRHSYSAVSGRCTSIEGRKAGMGKLLGPSELIPERHRDHVFGPCDGDLPGQSLGWIILLVLGHCDYCDPADCIWMALSKRYRWFGSSGTRIRISLRENFVLAYLDRTRAQFA